MDASWPGPVDFVEIALTVFALVIVAFVINTIVGAFKQRESMRTVLHRVVDNPSTNEEIRKDALEVLRESEEDSVKRQQAFLGALKSNLDAPSAIREKAGIELAKHTHCK